MVVLQVPVLIPGAVRCDPGLLADSPLRHVLPCFQVRSWPGLGPWLDMSRISWRAHAQVYIAAQSLSYVPGCWLPVGYLPVGCACCTLS